MIPVEKTIEPLEVRQVAALVTELSVMAYFPPDIEARKAIAQELVRICPNLTEARWLVMRFAQLYNRWPGLRELRAVYCSRNRPRDGVEINSLDFPDGVPSPPPGSELAWVLPAPEQPTPLLPAGHQYSADIEMENSVRQVAASSLRTRPPRKPEPPVNPNFKPITQADIDRAVEEHRQKQGQREFNA